MDSASKKPSARRTSAGSSATRYMQCDRGHKKVCETCQSTAEDRKEVKSTSSRSLPPINTSEPQQRSSTARSLSRSNTSNRSSRNDTTRPPSPTDTSQPQRQSSTAKTLSRSNTTQSTRNDTTQPSSPNPPIPWFKSRRLREKAEEDERNKKEGKRIDFLNQHAHLERSPSPKAAKETKTPTSQKSVAKKKLDEPPSKTPKAKDPLAEELFPEDEPPAPEIEKRHANELRPRPTPDYSTLKASKRKVQPAEGSDSGSPPVSAPWQRRKKRGSSNGLPRADGKMGGPSK